MLFLLFWLRNTFENNSFTFKLYNGQNSFNNFSQLYLFDILVDQRGSEISLKKDIPFQMGVFSIVLFGLNDHVGIDVY